MIRNYTLIWGIAQYTPTPPVSRNVITIFTELGKLIYNRVLIGMCAYGYIFQSKVDELLGDIQGFRAYINNVMVLVKGSFPQHIDQIRVIFYLLLTEVLKFNVNKRRFGLKYIPYQLFKKINALTTIMICPMNKFLDLINI